MYAWFGNGQREKLCLAPITTTSDQNNDHRLSLVIKILIRNLTRRKKT
jgi:hypothetical protein